MRASNQTKGHILEAACRVFAEKGFRDATGAEICKLAGANSALVNYYFGGKDELYMEAINFAYEKAAKVFPVNGGCSSDSPAEERLRAFVSALVHRTFCEEHAGWLPKILVKEMAEPTFADEEIFKKIILPQADFLCSAIKELLGDKAEEMDAHLCGISTVSQCLYLSFNKSMRQRFFAVDGSCCKSPLMQKMVHHITEFSLAGIAATRKRIEEGAEG